MSDPKYKSHIPHALSKNAGVNFNYVWDEVSQHWAPMPLHLNATDILLSEQGVSKGVEHIHQFGSLREASEGNESEIIGECNNFPYFADKSALTISSTSNLDQQRVIVNGLNEEFDPQVAEVYLSGTADVPVPHFWSRIFSLSINSSNSLEGDVTIENAEGTEYSKILAANNQSLQGYYTIPAGKTGHLLGYNASAFSLETEGSPNFSLSLYIRELRRAPKAIHTFNVSTQSTPSFDLRFPIQIPERSDIYFVKKYATHAGQIYVDFQLSLSDSIEKPIISATPTKTPTVTPTVTATTSVTPNSSLTPTVTPTNTVTPTVTPTNTVTPTVTPTNTVTPTITPTSTVTPTVTATSSVTPTNTVTPTSTITPTVTPTSTITPTASITPSNTITPTVTATSTTTPTVTATSTTTPTVTATSTTTPTVTPTSTITPTNTPTNTATPTVTASITPSSTVTPTSSTTPTPTPTVSPAWRDLILSYQTDPFILTEDDENRVLTVHRNNSTEGLNYYDGPFSFDYELVGGSETFDEALDLLAPTRGTISLDANIDQASIPFNPVYDSESEEVEFFSVKITKVNGLPEYTRVTLPDEYRILLFNTKPPSPSPTPSPTVTPTPTPTVTPDE